MPRPVDLRSDTVTQPTPAMREAMMAAELGDDVLGDDPTVQRLERQVAELAGKDAAMYVPSGTMGNQLAVYCHTSPGDEVVLDRDSHIYCYEQGGLSANSGCLANPVETAGRGLPADVLRRVLVEKYEDDHYANLRLVCMENTHNRHGGTVVPLDSMRALCATAHEHDVQVHLDGARLWNASTATGIPIREWAKAADSVMMCFSKGLGAPIGSILTGTEEFIRRARRARKRWGGGMRQVGLLAGACLHAIEHHVARLAEDHERARALAAGIRTAPGIRVPDTETNILMVHLEHASLDGQEIVDALEARGVRVLQMDSRRLRALTHLDVDDAGIERAIEAFQAVIGERVGTAAGRDH